MGNEANRPVLLIEPDADLREVLLEVLRGQDLLCTAAASVDLDPTVLESIDPRLIILAPAELDPARALLRRLDQRPTPPPVLLLTSHRLHTILATHPCVAGSLEKPFDTQAFVAAVARYGSPD